MTLKKFIFPILVITLLLIATLSLLTGAAKITWPDFTEALIALINGNATSGDLNTLNIIFQLRLPRVLGTLLVGATLGITGAALQGLFRNPLADPGLVGVSAGATLFAALSILLAGGLFSTVNLLGLNLMMAFAAFAGALGASFIVYRLASYRQQTDMATLLLAGIAFNALAAAITGLVIYMSNDSQMRSIAFWTMGSLAGTAWKELAVMLPFFITSAFLILRRWKSLNAFSLGEREARYLGENTTGLKREMMLATALGVGVAVAFCGIISFVGLVVPHLVRMTLSSNHRRLLPGAALMGANILLMSDLLCRTLAAPAEIPVGIITAIIGVPFFIYLIIRNRSRLHFATA